MSKKKMSKGKPDEYIDDLNEWSENQYNPGHWTGGNVPPFIKYGGKPMGYTLMGLGLVIVLSTLFTMFPIIMVNLLYNVLLLILGMVFFVGGWKKTRRQL